MNNPDQKPAAENSLGIVWGEIRYPSYGAQFVYEFLRPKVEPVYTEKQKNPETVQQAFILDRAKWYLEFPDLWTNAIDTKQIGYIQEDDGTLVVTKSPEEIVTIIQDTFTSQEDSLEGLQHSEKMIEVAEQLIDSDDVSNVQIVIFKDTKQNNLHNDAYTIYVVYPPTKDLTGSVIRKREISKLTQGCQTLDIAILFSQRQKFLRILMRDRVQAPMWDIAIGKKEYTAKRVKIENLSDEELSHRIERFKERRSILDKALQKSIGLLDRLRKRNGQHIDLLKAITDRSYAKTYALATHKGIEGVVANHKIILPPTSSSLDSAE
jgi:hypothetical protein